MNEVAKIVDSFDLEECRCLRLSPSVLIFCPEDLGRMSSSTLALVYLTAICHISEDGTVRNIHCHELFFQKYNNNNNNMLIDVVIRRDRSVIKKETEKNVICKYFITEIQRM